jgi:hypothetical protein
MLENLCKVRVDHPFLFVNNTSKEEMEGGKEMDNV